MDIEQADRWLKLDSPLGENVLIPMRLDAREGMSMPFHVRLECISERTEIAPDEILGARHTAKVGHGQDLRLFNGIVKSLAPGPTWARGLRVYWLELVPDLWFLTLTTDLRIFQDLSAVEIILKLFREHGITDVDPLGIRESHATRTYCVQYRESTFAFISRLMEEEGITYFFEHREDGHTLKLADSTGAYTANEIDEIDFHPGGQVAGSVESWEPRVAFRSAKWTLRDYNFEMPDTDLTARESTVLGPSAFEHEVYDYPGRYQHKNRGAELAGFRMEAHESDYDLVDGTSRVRMLRPGTTFRLRKHPSPEQNEREVVLREVRHSATDHSHISGNVSVGSSYENSFVAMPSDRVFRPEATTPKPVVHGPHTAVVVGPSGEEIHCDQYGRIKVQFHWDRLGRNDDRSSCWLRVAQGMAGRNWGSLFTPRIGMEVVVEFLEGDPDRPLVVGCVYNAKNMPPYKLPTNKTQSGFKSRSSPNGGAADFNELRFEDKAGQEQVYVHAQKDFDRVVERDDTREVGRNETITVKEGDRTVNVDLGSEYTEAQRSIEMKVGQNSIVIDQGGITIKGIKVKIEGSASISMNAPMSESNGSGILRLKGGLVRIN